MREKAVEKVRAEHLQRKAYLYVRQSTMRQVIEHQESTRRQYALSQQAVALGWPFESIEVIDEDQGHSSAIGDRQGFERLVSEVGMGRAGIVLSLEAARLARNNTRWHRLLEIYLVETINPAALDVALAVHKELQDRLEQADKLRYRQVERARQEAELARR